MLLLALLATLLVLAVAAWRITWTTRRATTVGPASVRVHTALTDLTAARADFEDVAGRLAATLAVHTANPSTGGFGDAHVRRARLRAALADPAGEQLA